MRQVRARVATRCTAAYILVTGAPHCHSCSLARLRRAWRRGRITEPQVSGVLVQPRQGCMSREAAYAPRHVKLHCTIAHTRAPLGRWSVRRCRGAMDHDCALPVCSRGGGQPAAMLSSRVESSQSKLGQAKPSLDALLGWLCKRVRGSWRPSGASHSFGRDDSGPPLSEFIERDPCRSPFCLDLPGLIHSAYRRSR